MLFSLLINTSCITKEKATMNYADYVNQSINGAIYIENSDGVFFGTIASDIYYYPKDISNAKLNWKNWESDESSSYGIRLIFPENSYGSAKNSIFTYKNILYMFNYDDRDNIGQIYSYKLDLKNVEKNANIEYDEYQFSIPKNDIKKIAGDDIYECFFGNGNLYYIKHDPFRIFKYNINSNQIQIIYQRDIADIPQKARMEKDGYDYLTDVDRFNETLRETFAFDGKRLYFYGINDLSDHFPSVYYFDIITQKVIFIREQSDIKNTIHWNLGDEMIIQKYGELAFKELAKSFDIKESGWILQDDCVYFQNKEDEKKGGFNIIHKINLLNKKILSVEMKIFEWGTRFNTFNNRLFITGEDLYSTLIEDINRPKNSTILEWGLRLDENKIN